MTLGQCGRGGYESCHKAILNRTEISAGKLWLRHCARARRFGFETGSTFVDGLWQGPTALSQDFGTIAYRMQLLGFNTVRLPMSFQVCGLAVYACTWYLIPTILQGP